MPLARIVTEFPEEAVELAMQLRSRGFRVETVSPKTVSNAAADLEVRLEECAIEDVPGQASAIAAGEEVCVFVAPGALEQSAGFEGAFPASFAFAGPVKREFAPVEEEEEDDRGLPEAETPSVSLASAPVELTELGESDSAVSARDLNDGLAENPEVAEPVAQLENSETVPPVEIARALLPEVPGVPEDAVPNTTEVDARQAEAVTDAPITPPAPQRGYWSGRNVRESAGSPQKVAPLQAPMVGQGASWERVEPPRASAMPELTEIRRVVLQSRPRAEADRAFWKIAVASAALATLVVLVGSVWHRARPMPANLVPSAGQRLPFHEPAKKAALPPAPLKNVASERQTTAINASTPKSTSTPGTASGADTIKTASVVVPSSQIEPLPVKPVVAPQHKRARASDAGIIAEDTVIFYDRKPAPVNKPPQPAVKRHSDLQ